MCQMEFTFLEKTLVRLTKEDAGIILSSSQDLRLTQILVLYRQGQWMPHLFHFYRTSKSGANLAVVQ